MDSEYNFGSDAYAGMYRDSEPEASQTGSVPPPNTRFVVDGELLDASMLSIHRFNRHNQPDIKYKTDYMSRRTNRNGPDPPKYSYMP